MLWCLEFSSSTVLKMPAIFLLASRSRSKLRAIQIAWKRLIGPLWVPLFINQSKNSVCFSFLHRISFFCTKLTHFCIEFTKNCISLSQSDSRNFFMYLKIEIITTSEVLYTNPWFQILFWPFLLLMELKENLPFCLMNLSKIQRRHYHKTK